MGFPSLRSKAEKPEPQSTVIVKAKVARWLVPSPCSLFLLFPKQLRRVHPQRPPRRNPCRHNPNQHHRSQRTQQHQRIARSRLIHQVSQQPARQHTSAKPATEPTTSTTSGRPSAVPMICPRCAPALRESPTPASVSIRSKPTSQRSRNRQHRRQHPHHPKAAVATRAETAPVRDCPARLNIKGRLESIPSKSD